MSIRDSTTNNPERMNDAVMSVIQASFARLEGTQDEDPAKPDEYSL